MTEIQFLVSLLLNEQMDESLRTKLLVRINEVEKRRTNWPIYPTTIPYITTPFVGAPVTADLPGSISGSNITNVTLTGSGSASLAMVK